MLQMERTTTMKLPIRISSTVWSALAGALFVGLASAFSFALALAPQSGIPFGVAEVALAFFLGAVFGTIAGGVAGASEVEPSADRAPEGAASTRTAIRHMGEHPA
jgi:hypothetical protein